jgi:hypothetical protein
MKSLSIGAVCIDGESSPSVSIALLRASPWPAALAQIFGDHPPAQTGASPDCGEKLINGMSNVLGRVAQKPFLQRV